MRLPGIEGEVEPIDNFDGLRPGIRIVVTDCDRCGFGTHHKAMLIGRGRGHVQSADGNVRFSEFWEFAPVTVCGGDVFDRSDVAERRVLRVVDPIMDAERDTIARVRKLERVR